MICNYLTKETKCKQVQELQDLSWVFDTIYSQIYGNKFCAAVKREIKRTRDLLPSQSQLHEEDCPF